MPAIAQIARPADSVRDQRPFRTGTAVDRMRRPDRRPAPARAHLEVLGFVAAGIAHDIRNLLAVVTANLDALENCPGLTQDMRARIDGMRELVLSGAGLTGRLARASGPASHRTVAVPVAAAAVAAAKLLRLAVPPGIRIETAIDAPDATIRATEGEIESALINLVRNAVHAMPGGGAVRIRVGMTRNEGEGARVVLSVVDQGHGMTEAVRQRAALPFFTSKGTGGSGLGLATVARFAEGGDGRLRIDSALGRGTCVSLSFPAVAAM